MIKRISNNEYQTGNVEGVGNFEFLIFNFKLRDRLRRCCFIYLFAGLVLVLLVGGCQQEAVTYARYSCQVERPFGQVDTTNGVSIRIGYFGAAKPYKYKSFVYQKGDNQFETDYYNQFLSFPAEMIMEKTYYWFAESGIFENVVRWDDPRQAGYELVGHIKSLYGDFSEKNKQSAVMEIEFELVEPGAVDFVLKTIYKSVVEFDDRQPAKLAEAYGECLEEILSELEADLKLKFKN